MSKVFSFFVLAFLLIVASCDAAKIVAISEICKTTENPSFCSALLNKCPGGKDLVSLGQCTIDLARAKVTNTITLLKSLIAKSGSDPNAKAHYKNCLDIFGEEGALGDVDDTQRAFKMTDYLGMSIHASALLDRPGDCVSGENPGLSVFHDPSVLPQYADVVKKVSEIILILSNDLRGAL